MFLHVSAIHILDIARMQNIVLTRDPKKILRDLRWSKPDLTSCGWAAGKWLMCLPQVFQFLLGTTLEDQANILLNICAHLQHILCNAYCCMSIYLRARCKYHKYHSLWALKLSRYALMFCNYDRWTDFWAWRHEGDGAYKVAVLRKSWMVSPVLSSGHVAISRPYSSISRRWQSPVEGCESAAYGLL